MKKALILLLSMVVVFSAMACGSTVVPAAVTTAVESMEAPAPELTPTATPTPSPSPSPTPVPTPEISREDALKQMNISSDSIYSFTDLIVFECTLIDGREVKFLAQVLIRVGDGTIFIVNVMDGERFATFKTDFAAGSAEDMLSMGEFELIPEFLKGAKINTTYGIYDIPRRYEELGKKLPESLLVEYLANIIMDESADLSVLEEKNLRAIDCANLFLDLFPYNEIVNANDYIEGYVPTSPQDNP